MAFPFATLNGVQLPPQFSYKPYMPQKRVTTTRTSNTVVIQYSNPVIVHGEDTVAWAMDGVYPSEFKQLWDLYDTTTPVPYSFVGYWGETLIVNFSHFDNPTVRSRLFSCSGMFQVLGVSVPYDPSCSY